MSVVIKVSEIVQQIQDKGSYSSGIMVKKFTVQMEGFRAEVEGMKFKSPKEPDSWSLENSEALRRAIIFLLYDGSIFTTIDGSGERVDWRIHFVKGILPQRLIREIGQLNDARPLHRVRDFSEMEQKRSYRWAKLRIYSANQPQAC